jgi:L-tyrosine isonitrile synthase
MNRYETFDRDNSYFRQVLDLLLPFSGLPSFDPLELQSSAFLQKLAEKIVNLEPLIFILPAFPAKSANRQKTSGHLPDMGELIALFNLNQVCQKISSFYGPSAKVVICSDGRVFNDLVLVSDEDLMAYKNKVAEIIHNFKLNYLTQFSLEDCMPGFTFQLMRERLVLDFGPDLDFLRFKVKEEPTIASLYNGLHRFIIEDRLELESNKSKSKIAKESKLIAYQVMQRSQAWDKLLERYFPNTLRLSIHPYPITHHKFGIKLVQSSDKWATPWHNVVLKTQERYQLKRRHEVLSLGAHEKRFQEEFVYYEI